jgi:hypothetical protein
MKLEIGGKKVLLEAFHCTNTYAGLILGSPTAESNQRLINHLNYPKDWGNRFCVMKKSDMYVNKNELKPKINSVWLSSSIPVKDTKADGADLVIMWFSNEQLDKTIKEIITAGVGDVEWEKFATDFWL